MTGAELKELLTQAGFETGPLSFSKAGVNIDFGSHRAIAYSHVISWVQPLGRKSIYVDGILQLVSVLHELRNQHCTIAPSEESAAEVLAIKEKAPQSTLV